MTMTIPAYCILSQGNPCLPDKVTADLQGDAVHPAMSQEIMTTTNQDLVKDSAAALKEDIMVKGVLDQGCFKVHIGKVTMKDM